MPNRCCLSINYFQRRQSAFAAPKMSKCVPGMAWLLKLIRSRSQYFNGIDITHLCWHDTNIPTIPIVQPHCLHYFSLSQILYLFPLFSLPSVFFSFSLLSLTMGGLRLLQVGGGGFLRVIAGPVAHRDIQISDVRWLSLKSVFHGPFWCGQIDWDWLTGLLFDLLIWKDWKFTMYSKKLPV